MSNGMSVLALLKKAVEEKALRALDFQFARLMASDAHPFMMLALACVSAEAGAGHVCLPLSRLSKTTLFGGRLPELAEALWQCTGNLSLAGQLEMLSSSPLVSSGRGPAPLVLSEQRLYLQRMWLDEGRIAAFLNQQAQPVDLDRVELRGILAELFPETQAGEVNWQQIAAAVACTRKVAVISGGPGTGKTTTVARLLAALVLLAGEKPLRIGLAAPTGKAAARLTESLGKVNQTLPLTEEQKKALPTETSTLHRLLGAQPDSQRFRYHRDNPLHLDVLVVDEASMVDLPLMARLTEALPAHARLILLGDRDQLASVEAGAVLGDICRFAEAGYSPQRAEDLSQLTHHPLPQSVISAEGATIRDSLCLLRKSYRFDANSGIGQLALAVNQGESKTALACLSGDFADLEWHTMQSSSDYVELISGCVAHYRHYLMLVAQQAPADEILTAFGQFQLLCALREGPFGIKGLNEQLERALQKAGLINLPPSGRSWYPGKPVMLGRNDSSLGLFNGDVGIALYDAQNALKVFFQLPEGKVKAVQPNRLPAYDTAYAMTVHKSQGSEFEHTLLALPDRYSPLLTRELVYTAITRARSKLTLYASESIFSKAVVTLTERRSGLSERLLQERRFE